MNPAGSILAILAVLCMLPSLQAKPIYDFRSSYVTQLTNFNFKDQVTKIRQNTNYVAVVQFYKYGGRFGLMQMASRSLLRRSSMSGCMSTMGSSALALSIATSMPNFAPKRGLLSSPPSRSTHLILYPPPPSPYARPHAG